MATQEIKDLLLEAGPFARLSATEQRTKLVIYYQSWFLSDYRIDTVNNIRASQRLTTHAKAMGSAVGVVLQAILLEASGIEPRAHGLLGVEVARLINRRVPRAVGTQAYRRYSQPAARLRCRQSSLNPSLLPTHHSASWMHTPCIPPPR